MLSYSVRLRRRAVTRPGSTGALACALAIAPSRAALNAVTSAADGCDFAFLGGISPVLTCCNTDRHVFRSCKSRDSSLNLVRSRSALALVGPWHSWQCCCKNACACLKPGCAAHAAATEPSKPTAAINAAVAVRHGKHLIMRLGIPDWCALVVFDAVSVAPASPDVPKAPRIPKLWVSSGTSWLAQSRERGRPRPHLHPPALRDRFASPPLSCHPQLRDARGTSCQALASGTAPAPALGPVFAPSGPCFRIRGG